MTMDILRRDGSHYDDQADEAPGIEAQPMIGQDERRMHVRAYNFWAKMLEGRSFPSIESLDLDNIGDFGENAVLLDFTSGIENPAITYIGNKLAEECALSEDVQYIGDVPRRSLLSRLTDHYLQIIANRAPIGFEAEFVNALGKTIMYRGVLLPFSSDDDTIDFILGVINWKQAAEDSLSEQIAQELETASPPSARPTVPVWADGPDAAAFDAASDEADQEEEEEYAAALDAATEDEPVCAVEDAYADESDADAPAAAYSTDEDDDALLLDNAIAIDDGHADSLVAADDHGEDFDAPAEFEPEDASLADWLASARDCANMAEQSGVRTRNALYQAIGRAYGFALATAQEPEDYAEMLAEAGIKASPRAPMTPVVKLVFGVKHDKTRLAEYAAVLTYAQHEALDPQDLPAVIASHDGGLKGLVKSIRAANRPQATTPVDADAALLGKLAQMPALSPIAVPEWYAMGDYTVLVIRREADDTQVIIGARDESDAAARAMMKAMLR